METKERNTVNSSSVSPAKKPRTASISATKKTPTGATKPATATRPTGATKPATATRSTTATKPATATKSASATTQSAGRVQKPKSQKSSSPASFINPVIAVQKSKAVPEAERRPRVSPPLIRSESHTSRGAGSGYLDEKPVRSRYVEGIMVRSDSAVSQYGRRTERNLRAKYMSSMLKAIGTFELFYYPVYIIGGLLCLIFLPLTFTLVCSILSMWFALLANNLVARGYRFGLLLSTVFMLLYTIVSGMTAVWGEVVMNVLFYIPLEIQGFFKWKSTTNEDSGKLQEIKRLTAKGWGLTLLAFAGITLGLWIVFGLIIKQDFAIVNCLSIAGFLIGNVLRNKRYIEVWYFFMIGNISGVALWALVAVATGEVIDLSVLPLMLSFTSSLLNNFNGLAIWRVLYKTNQKSSGVILTSQVKIKNISRLRKKFHNMRCAETQKIK